MWYSHILIFGLYGWLKNIADGGDVLGNSMIAPNTQVQYMSLVAAARDLMIDPFIRHHVAVPLGQQYFIADGKRTTIGMRAPLQPYTWNSRAKCFVECGPEWYRIFQKV